MTIGAPTNRIPFNCDGVTKVFPVNLQAYQASDFTVILTSSTGTELTLVLNSDYSLAASGTLAPTAWTLTTLAAAAYATGNKLQVFTNPVQTQPAQFVQNQAFPSLAVQTAFDRITQMVQRLQDQINRSVLAPDGDVNPLLGLPTASQRANTYATFDVNGNLSVSVGLIAGTTLSASAIGAFTGPATAAEIATGVTVVAPWLPVGNLLRYGIVPNSVGAAAANTAILAALLNYNTAGPTGKFFFPNTTGADIYTFASTPITVRPYVSIDLQGCTINVTGAATANDVNTGFFYPLSDFVLENGSINTAVDCTLGLGAAACIQVGARGSTNFYFPIYSQAVFDSLLPSGKSQGRVILRNLGLSNSNTNTSAGKGNHTIDMLGGLSNVLLENITINNNSTVGAVGIYYEWGWATSPSGASAQTSHGHNMVYRNLRIINCANAAVGVTGAYNVIVDGLFAQGCTQAFLYSVGEAMFFRPWVGVDQVGAKRNCSLRNAVGQTISGTAIQLAGANLASGTYLSGQGLTPTQQTDLMTFTLENVVASSLVVSGPITARNCKFDGAGALLNPVTINDDCILAIFDNCQALNGTGDGVRANIAGTGVWSPIRQKFIRWNGGLVAGNVTGFSLNNIRNTNISQCRIGFSTLYDAAAEATQTVAVSVNSGAQNVVCDSNFCTQSGGGTSYTITGTTSSGCNLINPLGTITNTGGWENDGMASATNGQLLDKTSLINTANKRFGRRVWNSNGYLMIAQGPLVTDTWVISGFGTSTTILTPV